MKNKYGQTALILILLAAAALIFLAITLNWGRIAQVKALVTVAADQSASLMASDAASYGEMQKQTNLNDTNQIIGQTGILLALLLVIVSIIVAFFAPEGFYFFLAMVSVVMATANLVLQVVVIQPGITSLWNSLQKNQPIPQQFYEGGVAAALEGSVGDQVNITDYLDWNANGKFGSTSNGITPNDTVSRFAVFYTDRLKMLNKPTIPQVAFFYGQLGELMNGETCDQNETDYASYPGVITLNPACQSLGSQHCINDPIDPACQIKIPNVFQLNDACTGSDPANTATYNPYCDPCCQLLTVNGKALRPSNCSADTSAFGAPVQCLTNNPYGGGSSQRTLLYDPAFQNYAAGLSFLDQFGRDQQMGPFTTSLTPQGSPSNGTFFPNGIYPFFWLMNNYSPEVDNINSGNLQSSQVHWCAAGGSIPSSGTPPAGYSDLTQLSLPYSCSGQDCCVNYLPNKITNGLPDPSSGTTIDMAGSPSFGPNPALDPSFGEGGVGSWLPGDNQMCLPAWPYNGSSTTGAPDGTCEITPPMTVDSLDDTMHTLSGFVNFANIFLNNDIGTLSATFQTWYPQAAVWIDPSTGRLPPLVANLSAWNTIITNWLNTVYTSNGAWCVPSEATLLNGNGSTVEDTYINSNSATATWGDLPHVMACLNYNSNQNPAAGSVYNYQQCLTALSGECPPSLPAACAASVLGRSLVAGAVPLYSTGCDVNTAGSYGKWVNDSLILATDEAPKFALRAAFLTDVYNRAKTMPNIFQAGNKALSAFLAPCSGSNCSDGGPAAQLTYAYSQPSPTSLLPNSVIYGWVDNTYLNGRQGYAHIVKVTAYSVGRRGGSSLPNPSPDGGGSVLPWIETKCEKTFLGLCIKRSYTLVARDGWVYASVRRWDEDHGNSVLFPNGHPLWQFLFHNPKAGSMADTTGQGLMQTCNGLTLPGNGGSIGFGLEPQTVAGLGYNNQISSKDTTAFANAFMLNDNVNGTVDPNSKTNPEYASCLSAANQLLANAPESHVCAQYIASRNASGSSGNDDSDYSLKFVSCGQQPEDLTYTTGVGL